MTETPEFAAFVGIDWADQKHDACLLAGRAGPQRSDIPQTPEGIADWAISLRTRFEGRPIAVCLEQSRGPLLYALMQYEFLVLFPINPSQLANYRKALYPSGAKSDPNDAELLAMFVRDHREKLRAWKPDDEVTRSLRLYCEQRRNWVESRVALTNELKQRLKETYPLALQFQNGDLHAKGFLHLLAKFPTQRELQRASPKQLAQFLPKRRCLPDDPPAEELLKQEIDAIRQALPLTNDRPLIDHARTVILHTVALIQMYGEGIADCDQKIKELYTKHQDHAIYESLPGAGDSMAPRLAAAMGIDRSKFGEAIEVQQLSGIAPVTKSSGKTEIISARWAYPRFLRQTFHEWAQHSLKKCAWARAYVAMRKAAGVKHHTIIRALAFKWQRILFRCWKNHEPYDDARYLESLRKSGSPIVRFLPLESE